MSESKKIFSLPIAAMMIMLALLCDGLLIIFWLMLGIPVVGEVVAPAIEVFNLVIGLIFQAIFFIAVKSFGKTGALQLAGTIVEAMGIPGRTITVGLGIYIANDPKISAITSIAKGNPSSIKGAVSALEEQAKTTPPIPSPPPKEEVVLPEPEIKEDLPKAA